ncbi:MAG TPA: helix-turn-helix domain-containing protein, partial [Actinomycetes bacterium]|nr:helix-turn-helix domain-containing protein [Actinomycetes bacterium]
MRALLSLAVHRPWWPRSAHCARPNRAAILNQMVRYSTLDRTFAALSDPTRREILDRLAEGPATLGELRRPFDMTLPGLMKHVRV